MTAVEMFVEAIFFQFPVGIRWCSDEDNIVTAEDVGEFFFQFPVGIRWCSDQNDPGSAERGC